MIDSSGQLRAHLWQEAFQGTTIWADLHVDDITPAPDQTLQHPLGIYATSFETADSSWTLGTATRLQDSTQSHSGQYSIKDTLANNTTTNTVSRSMTVTSTAVYRVSAWVRTIQSGSVGAGTSGGGGDLCVQLSTSYCSPYTMTEGQWVMLTVLTAPGSGTLTIGLNHVYFQGDVYWDDVSVEEVAGQSPPTSGYWHASAWSGSATGGTATWSSSWSGGFANGPSRQVSINPAITDASDKLPTSALRTNATYVLSFWASASPGGGTVSFGLNTPTATCNLSPSQNTPVLCQAYFVYSGSYPASNYFLIDYGGAARIVTISHPVIALASQLTDYTSTGRVADTHDVFGHNTTYTYDSNGLYLTQAVVTATPSPNLTTDYNYNSVGQLILQTKVNGSSSIAQQIWLDSWGRTVGTVENCVTAVAPPSLCNATPDPATNVMTRFSYDLNGNLVDRYQQGQTSGSWVDTHFAYDADNNQIAAVSNCVTNSKPCDGSSGAAQNVVATQAFDVLNNLSDAYAPAPGCTGTSGPCVPLPACTSSGICSLLSAPCPSASCVDQRRVYNQGGRLAQDVANFGGTQDVSQANVTTQYAYDGDGRVTDIFAPTTNAALETGQIDERKVYDALGRLVTDVKAYAIPSWMASSTVTNTTSAETDYTLDAGGRVISATGPGTGSPAVRVVTNTTYDDLNRPLTVTVDPSGLNALNTTVYDPTGAVHSWTPATQQLSGGMETTTHYDLAGQVTSVVKDDATTLAMTTSTAHDGYGRPTDVTDPRGVVTHTVYDALDRASSVTQNYCPSGNTNPNCNGSGVLSDQNLATSYVYDFAGNRTQVVNPRSIVEYTGFDALGRAVAVSEDCQTIPTPPAVSCGTQSSDQNVLSQESFDQAGDLLSTTDPLLRVNTYAYDALGRKTSATQNYCTSNNPPNCTGSTVTSSQNLTTTWQLDALGDVLTETQPRQCTTSAPCYKGSGSSITDGANLATGYLYDGMQRLVQVVEDQGSSANGHLNLQTTYTYDASGDRLKQTDGNGKTTTYTIDDLGRTTKVTDASNNVEQTNYSLAGEVESTVNARGKTNNDTLDTAMRLVGVSYLSSSGGTLTKSFTYDADGNQTCFTPSTGTGACGSGDASRTTVSFDHLNRVSTVTAPSPYGTTTYTYFLDGATNTIVDANGTTTFTEDHLGRTASMVDPVTSGTTSYTYDAAGRVTSRTEANGIVTTVGYTPIDQLSSKTEVSGTTTLASWTSITYDLAQNRTGETLAYYAANPYPDAEAGTATYKYDSLNQLSQANLPGKTAANYAFDSAHNLTSNAGTAQTFNANESLQTACGVTLGSDADGNLLKDCAGNSLSWNSLSQLDAFGTTETYTYDPIGRLLTVTNGSNVTKFVYQGLSGQVIQELSSTNAVIRSYAWDSSGRQLYAKSGSSVWYEITDPHGDVAALATGTALAGTEHFDAWGNLLNSGGGTIPFGYQGSQGSWTDSTTGLVSMGVRWYYPKVSQFTSSDPAAGTANPRTPIDRLRWLYVSNSPLDISDPSGLGCLPGDPCSNRHFLGSDPLALPAPTTTPPTSGSHDRIGRGHGIGFWPTHANQQSSDPISAAQHLWNQFATGWNGGGSLRPTAPDNFFDMSVQGQGAFDRGVWNWAVNTVVGDSPQAAAALYTGGAQGYLDYEAQRTIDIVQGTSDLIGLVMGNPIDVLNARDSVTNEVTQRGPYGTFLDGETALGQIAVPLALTIATAGLSSEATAVSIPETTALPVQASTRLTNAQVGDIIQWGRGASGPADTMTNLANLDPGHILGFEMQGLTPERLRELLLDYQAAKADPIKGGLNADGTPVNPNLDSRIAYLKRILEIWDRQPKN